MGFELRNRESILQRTPSVRSAISIPRNTTESVPLQGSFIATRQIHQIQILQEAYQICEPDASKLFGLPLFGFSSKRSLLVREFA